eukprot:TRINITY_DN3002_c0_g1_i1.p1 TRINITY_DN3002_c0_g1~~TRINITY_DN3002_c0_g1_i1.p1  ORF type:complete len:468 (+),score=53.71 TRINITY_DN3002_c0_g1_i1:40-1443(+)
MMTSPLVQTEGEYLMPSEQSVAIEATTAAMEAGDWTLPCRWTFWVEQWKVVKRAAELCDVRPTATITNVPELQAEMLARPVEGLGINCSLHLFRDGTPPVYDHPHNRHGGHLSIRLPDLPTAVNAWRVTTLAVVAEVLPHPTHIRGITLLRKPQHVALRLWVKNSLKTSVIQQLVLQLHQLVPYPAKFTPHKYILETIRRKQEAAGLAAGSLSLGHATMGNINMAGFGTPAPATPTPPPMAAHNFNSLAEALQHLQQPASPKHQGLASMRPPHLVSPQQYQHQTSQFLPTAGDPAPFIPSHGLTFTGVTPPESPLNPSMAPPLPTSFTVSAAPPPVRPPSSPAQYTGSPATQPRKGGISSLARLSLARYTFCPDPLASAIEELKSLRAAAGGNGYNVYSFQQGDAHSNTPSPLQPPSAMGQGQASATAFTLALLASALPANLSNPPSPPVPSAHPYAAVSQGGFAEA